MKNQQQRRKEENIKKYAQQVAKGEEIEYNVNEFEQYDRQLDFCLMLLKSGIITKEDFLG